MDGLRRISFRVQHDCPVARLSAEQPSLELQCWSGHRIEVVSARQTGRSHVDAEAALAEHLDPVTVRPFGDGALAVWRPKVEAKASISRRLEKHGLLWLQPLVVQAGWERYDAIVFEEGGEAAALADLRAGHEVQVQRRGTIDTDDVAAALFSSLQPALAAPTVKQAEALAAAFEQGYYHAPRQATTAQVAEVMGLGRSAFEERLRGGENRLMAEVLPALAQSLATRP